MLPSSQYSTQSTAKQAKLLSFFPYQEEANYKAQGRTLFMQTWKAGAL